MVDAWCGVKVDEAEVDLMAGDAAAVVQRQDQLVLVQQLVDSRQALLHPFRQPQLDPHAEEYGSRIEDEPHHSEGEQCEPRES